MQVIEKISITVEQYIEQSYHEQVRAPLRCMNCLLPATLKRLGYYKRYTSGEDGKALQFHVARYLCKSCKRTTSCYRRLRSHTGR